MSEIRYITIPPELPVLLEGHDGAGNPANFVTSRTFLRLIKERTSDGCFGASLDTVLEASAIRNAFNGGKPGDVIGITGEQWNLLVKSTRTPAVGYNVEVMLQINPHVRAILDAPSVRPAVADDDVIHAAAE